MRKEILYEMSSPYRDNFRIQGFKFGEGEKCVAIVGPMRGDEIQQQYVCSQLVKELMEIEADGKLNCGKSILVIPTCNPFSMNVNHRFWSMDSTDINRMFPGYNLGETTQRIADAIFTQIKDYEFGMQLASFYIPGDFVPHVRMLQTGFEDREDAKLFGFPFVTYRKPLPFDTTLLNYNWQIWNCKAFSIYAGKTNEIELDTSQQTVDAILRFMSRIGVLNTRIRQAGYESVLLDEDDLINVKAQRAGILRRLKYPGEKVEKQETIAEVLDPYDGSVKEKVTAPKSGVVFFAHNKPLCLQNSILFRILAL